MLCLVLGRIRGTVVWELMQCMSLRSVKVLELPCSHSSGVWGFFCEEQTVVSGVPSSGQLALLIETHSQSPLLCAGGV